MTARPRTPRVQRTPTPRPPGAPGAPELATVTELAAALPQPVAPARPPIGERFRLLHACQRLITGDLAMAQTLQMLVRSTTEVVAVEAALIALVDDDGAVEHVVAHNLDPQRYDDAGDIAALSAALAGGGQVLARATITVPDGLRGTLFAVGPAVDGRFDDDDLEMLEACARSAGSAIEHAVLVHRARSSVQWLHASGEIARAMLADADIDALTEIVARAVSAAGADYGHLVVPTADGRLHVLAAHGHGIEDYLGATYEAERSALGRAVVEGTALRGPALAQMLVEPGINVHGFASYMLAPLLDATGTRGSVLLTRFAAGTPFTDSDLAQFSTYAAQVALAMQFADARADGERLQRVEARNTATREVSDIVMQRLFAVGLGLDMLSTRLAATDHHAALERHILDLDETIAQIRQRVFADGDTGTPPVPAFPRLPLPAAAVQDPRPAGPRTGRGRRRSDWRDGTGRPV